MLLPDVNVLVYAHREDAPDYTQYRAWLEDPLNSDHAYGMAELVLSGFLRIVTPSRIFNPPSPLASALRFVEEVRRPAHCVIVRPGPRHWGIFTRLCRTVNAKGNLIPDAYFAALALESGSEWITTDRDFSRFPQLRWRHPFD